MTKHSRRNSIIVAVILAIVVVGLVFAGLTGSLRFQLGGGPPTWIAPGWEIYDTIGGIGYNGQVLSSTGQFTPQYTDTTPYLGGSYWTFDLSPERASNNGHSNLDYGIANIGVSVGDIQHVDWSGNPIPNSQSVNQYSGIVRGNQTYNLDEHTYLFTVTVQTFADSRVVYQRQGFLSGATMPDFAHETSYPHECMALGDEPGDTWVGQPFQGGIYLKFVIDPWQGSGDIGNGNPPNSSYVETGAWAGVMNAYILQGSYTFGQVGNLFPGHPGQQLTPDAQAPVIARGGPPFGNQLDMYADDGTFANKAPITIWDPTRDPSTRIKSTVNIYFPINALEAGAYIHLNGGGTMDQLTPLDAYMQFECRVDVLMTHEFTLESAVHPPKPVPPVEYISWAQNFWTSLLQGIDPFGFLNAMGLGALEPFIWWIITVGVVLIIIFVLLAVFAPGALKRIFGGIKSSSDALKGKS